MQRVESLTLLPLTDIKESKSNPRVRTWDKDKLQELADSIRSHGLLQPVLVRPGSNGSYHLVCGARRLRAAKIAGLERIQATIRGLTDKEVLEIQVIENLQRQDLHFLEEAEGFQALHESHGYAAEELAAKVGKSKAYVYARMKLCRLPADVKKACYDGLLDASRALLLARIPDPAQASKALKDLRISIDNPVSVRQMRRVLDQDFMRQLKDAPFDPADVALVPKAGACATCPKRTGNQPDLFSDCSADVCTDTKCFQAKADAAWLIRKEEARKAGYKTVEGTQGDKVRYSSGMVKLSASCWEDGKQRTWQRLTRDGEGLQKTLVRDSDGAVAEYVDRAAALKKAMTLGYLSKVEASTTRRSSEENTRLRAHKIRCAIVDQLMPLLVEAIAGDRVDGAAVWRFMAEQMFACGYSDGLRRAAKRREWKELRGYGRPQSQVAKRLDALSPTELRAFVIEVIAGESPTSTWSTTFSSTWTGACKLAGLNLKTAHAKATAAAKSKAKKKPTKGKTPKARRQAA